jgi:hypothetical protein
MFSNFPSNLKITRKIKIYKKNSEDNIKIFHLHDGNEGHVEYIKNENEKSKESLEYIIAIKSLNENNLILNFNLFLDKICVYLKKLHIFNSHLNLNLSLLNQDLTSTQTILELTNFSLSLPFFDDIPKYLETQFNTIIADDSCFIFTKNIPWMKINLLMFFHNLNGDKSENFLDMIIFKNRSFSNDSLNVSKFILNNVDFQKVLKENFSCVIIDKSDIHNVKIKNENEKSIIIIISYEILNDIDPIDNLQTQLIVSLTDEVSAMMKSSVNYLKEKNMFLLLDKKERDIVRIYERNFAIISKSLISVFKNVRTDNIKSIFYIFN